MIHCVLFFESSGTFNYCAASKFLDQIIMHLVLQLITHVADSEEHLRDLVIVLQMPDYCQRPISILLKIENMQCCTPKPF